VSRHFYYLVASLPPLFADKLPAMSSTDFLARCMRQLTAEEMQILESATWDNCDASGHPALVKWVRFERQLRNELVAVRAVGRGLNAVEHLRGLRRAPRVLAAVRGAVEASDPLTGERDLMMRRWRFLLSIEQRHHMSFDAVLAYYLRLQLAERWMAMSAEAGASELVRLREAAAQKALA
jgi:hypothetical protein